MVKVSGNMAHIALGIRRRATVLATSLLAIGALPRRAAAHPLHSTITEVAADRAHGVVRATIRVFADDFGTAVRRAAYGRAIPASGPLWDAAALAYTAASFGFAARGHALPLRSCGVRRTADLLWICVEASTTSDLGALQVRNAMLCDLFDDQVNVVQGTVAGSRASLLFVRGSGFKPLA